MDRARSEVSDDGAGSQTQLLRERSARSRRGWSIGRRLAILAPRLLAVLLAGGLAAGVTLNWNRWIGAAGPQWTDDAAMKADLTPLSAQVGGRIQAVLVNDFQLVRAGDPLVEIDDAPFRAQLDQAQANVAGAQAAIINLKAQEVLQAANIAAAEAQVNGTRATALRNSLEADRQRKLLVTRIAGTEQAVEQADAAAKLSTAQVMQSAAALEAARRQLDVQRTQEAQLAANLRAAEAARDLAQINVGYTRIAAPTDGMVGQRRVYPGQYVGVATQVITIAPLPRLYVIANYKETQLTHLRVGQRAEIRIDTFPGVVLHGHVASWSPATGAEFALLPPDNATGNFTKVVQRVPVKLMLDDDGGLGDRLRPGMSVETSIRTDGRTGDARE
ncbi:MAG TPA: HlyD family secretion protein [Rhodopila sp.]|jgi:membrane fusion protein (multidrug efflux system)|nr:HlyD family secretion protein [Rhodopila sp.]